MAKPWAISCSTQWALIGIRKCMRLMVRSTGNLRTNGRLYSSCCNGYNWSRKQCERPSSAVWAWSLWNYVINARSICVELILAELNLTISPKICHFTKYQDFAKVSRYTVVPSQWFLAKHLHKHGSHPHTTSSPTFSHYLYVSLVINWNLVVMNFSTLTCQTGKNSPHKSEVFVLMITFCD